MEEKVDVLVSLSDEHAPAIGEMTSKLEEAGLEVQQAMPEIGTISGRADPSRLSALRQVEGVASLEQAGSFQVAPPDSEVQ
jgi:hypothetical protein